MELLQPYLNVIVMTLIVVAALVIAILIYKMFTGRVRGRKGTRLGITEYYEIDKLRRLVLVRRDDVEHLMLIGGNQDVVIESNISAEMDEDEAPAPQMRAAPRPAVFGGNRPPLRPVQPNFDPRNG